MIAPFIHPSNKFNKSHSDKGADLGLKTWVRRGSRAFLGFARTRLRAKFLVAAKCLVCLPDVLRKVGIFEASDFRQRAKGAIWH